MSDVQAGYFPVADEYAARLLDELDHKPLDGELLDRFAERVRGMGAACDLGCGPGRIARYLHSRGVQARGVDLSLAMVERARALNSGIEFVQCHMRSLAIEDGKFGGIAAFYSIIHIPRREVVEVLHEMKRVLRPGGVLLLAFHVGDEIVHLDEWWGRRISVDFAFFRPEEMGRYLAEAGLAVAEIVEREPYPDVEHPSRRAYIFAEKPRGPIESQPD
ncbi:MAG: class I SAM-dependent methyltransferase [Planctomycetota bacterium]|nr:class I SAM-dependent methyltransferase [Planctomycetota bacterium]